MKVNVCRIGGVLVLSAIWFGGAVRAQGFDEIIHNAIVEGIQISSEPGKVAAEKIITCYFIFRDKPSSFYYEVKAKENKMVFEFNDTKKGASPITSLSEPPILGFTIEERKIDINKEVRGLTPEWHDMVRVSFELSHIPVITVNEEYSIISFSYKWSSDPSMIANYTVKEKKRVIIPVSIAAVGSGAAAFLIYWFTREEETVIDQPLSITDLPGCIDGNCERDPY